MKNTIFILFLLIVFQGILYAMETEIPQFPNTLSKKAQRVKQFLTNLNVDLNNKKAQMTINYFNNPYAGIPILIKKEKKKPLQSLSFFQKCWKFFECELFGYPLEELKDKLYLEKLRRNNCFYTNIKKHQDYGKDEYGIPYKIDKYSTALVLPLRANVKIDQAIDIPIFKRNFCYTNSFSGGYLNCASMEVSADKIDCQIKTNSWLNEQISPDVSLFGHAHEYAHLERGFFAPYRSLLITKAILGGVGLLTCGLLLQNSNIYEKLLGCGAGALLGIVTGNNFKQYSMRHEEKACDLRAIELSKPSNQTLETFFSLQPAFSRVSYEKEKWSIYELKVKHGKPSTITSDIHPSDAERLRYCKAYAQELGYKPSPPCVAPRKKFHFPLPTEE